MALSNIQSDRIEAADMRAEFESLYNVVVEKTELDWSRAEDETWKQLEPSLRAREKALKQRSKKGAPDDGEFEDRQRISKKRAYARLNRAAGKKEMRSRTMAQWVMAHKMDPPGSIDPDSVPCKEAVALLEWVQDTPGAFSQFFRDFFSKVAIQMLEDDPELIYRRDNEATKQLIANFIDHLQSEDGQAELEPDFDEAFAEEAEDGDGEGAERRKAIEGVSVVPD